jgi:hypothetical protein
MSVGESKDYCCVTLAVCILQRVEYRDLNSYSFHFVVTGLSDVTVMLAPVIK